MKNIWILVPVKLVPKLLQIAVQLQEQSKNNLRLDKKTQRAQSYQTLAELIEAGREAGIEPEFVKSAAAKFELRQIPGGSLKVLSPNSSFFKKAVKLVLSLGCLIIFLDGVDNGFRLSRTFNLKTNELMQPGKEKNV